MHATGRDDKARCVEQEKRWSPLKFNHLQIFKPLIFCHEGAHRSQRNPLWDHIGSEISADKIHTLSLSSLRSFVAKRIGFRARGFIRVYPRHPR
jgi:hypothetical protein